MKRFFAACLVIFLLLCILFPIFAGNADKPFILVPEADSGDWQAAVEEVGQVDNGGTWKTYNDKAKTFCDNKDLGAMIASGIMCWDVVLLLLTQIVKFIANMALVVGSGMVIFAGYKYTIAVYSGDSVQSANEAIKYAAIGIVIVIFSYAILKIAVNAFL